MNKEIEKHNFSTVNELFDYLSPWGEESGLDGFVFRGHSNDSYELTPAALRLHVAEDFWRACGSKPFGEQWNWLSWQIDAEYRLLRSFYRLADQRGLEVPVSSRMRSNLAQDFDTVGLVGFDQQDIWVPTDMHEVAALAQHYGVPTRLLDWTYDIYVALYFAFKGAIGKSGNLAIWALNKEYLSFLKPTVSKVNVEFITPHYSGNPNLNAQKGLFTLWPIINPSKVEHSTAFLHGESVLVDRRPLDVLVYENFTSPIDFPLFKKITVPCSEAVQGCKILDRLGYNPSRIFPGYGGVADQIMTQHALMFPELAN